MTFFTSKLFYRINQVLSLIIIPGSILGLVFGSFHERISSSGVMERARQVVLTSPMKETRIEEILVKEDDLVKAGAVLMRMSDINGTRNQLERAKIALAELKTRQKDMQPLQQTGAIPRQEYDTLLNDILRKENEVKDMAEQVGRLDVEAPFDGRVLQILPELYEKADIGTELVVFGEDTRTVLVCQIPEKQRTYVKPGQRVNIRSTQYNYIRYGEYLGAVESVSPYTRSSGDERTFEVRIRLYEAERTLPPGSTARAEIQIGAYPLWQLLLTRELSK